MLIFLKQLMVHPGPDLRGVPNLIRVIPGRVFKVSSALSRKDFLEMGVNYSFFVKKSKSGPGCTHRYQNHVTQ